MNTPIYLYKSEHTQKYLAQQAGKTEDAMGRWRRYLKKYGPAFKTVTRADLLKRLAPGVLVLPSVQVMDSQERQALADYAAAGGALLGTWAIGTRNPEGQFLDYKLIDTLFHAQVHGTFRNGKSWFMMPYGDGPLTWPMPAGRRMFIGDKTETSVLRIHSMHLAADAMSWERENDKEGPNGVMAFHESATSRAVYFSFSEEVWAYQNPFDMTHMLDSVMAWLRREPQAYKAAWPEGFEAAHLIEMDTEDKFASAVYLAQDLERIGARGTFYCLMSEATQHPALVRDLLARGHELAYHADIHIGFKSTKPADQERRIASMQRQMRAIIGDAVGQATGFRAPTESYDAVTERLLRRYGVLHHAADPSATEDRLPFFSNAEPGLSTEVSLVVLPRTQLDDVNFMAEKYSPEKVTEELNFVLASVVRGGGFGLLSVHSQNYVDGGLMRLTMPNYVKEVAKYKDRLWVARGDDISAWWRHRERVLVEQRPGTQAKTLQVHIAVQAPGQVRGLSVFVTHPAANVGPKLLGAEGLPSPVRVRTLDPYRSALVFEKLDVGDFTVQLQFP